MRNIFGDQGNMERNFWEHGNSVKVNLGEHLNFFLRNKGTTVNFHREQGNMHPPWKALIFHMTSFAQFSWMFLVIVTTSNTATIVATHLGNTRRNQLLT